MVKTLCFPFRGPRFDPWSGKKILHAVRHNQEKEQKEKLWNKEKKNDEVNINHIFFSTQYVQNVGVFTHGV